MKRRRLLIWVLAAGLASVSHRVYAEAARKKHRVGFISLRSGPGEFDAAFREALRALGYVEGRTIEIEYRWAAGNAQRAAELASDLVARKVDVIVAATSVAVRAAMQATRTIPIVIAVAADPVGSGLVANLSRPGGNVTGLTLISNDTAAKRLELLRELLPDLSRVAVLLVERGFPDESANNKRLLDQLQAAARDFAIQLSIATISRAADIDSAFAAIERERGEALFVPVNSIVIDHRARIIELASQRRLPAMYEDDVFVAAGGLLSYAPSIVEMYRRSATFVDRILKGASPAELPMEQPTLFKLAVNLRTARALGLTVRQTLLARADDVVE